MCCGRSWTELEPQQHAQVYAASIMFGYFVRRVDRRFQLERSLGMLPQNQEEAGARLERLFSQVPAALALLKLLLSAGRRLAFLAAHARQSACRMPRRSTLMSIRNDIT